MAATQRDLAGLWAQYLESWEIYKDHAQKCRYANELGNVANGCAECVTLTAIYVKKQEAWQAESV